ncbi:MAG: T9SS type A sorting domain-containing protein, partial [Candidatus Edwardsbacteria bacterium]|nr:T9SS type A sorting domain-containing protein [Candidatus Edwardsbacteria bacterium]
ESTRAYQLKYSWYNEGASDLGRLSSETDYRDSGHVYYQTWGPKSAGAAETRYMLGLPPGDTLILAMKARDESNPRRWSELGNEPRVVVYGDRVTPHSLGVGYSYGCVRDFISTELIEVRNTDTLFCTWDDGAVFFGYSRCDWRTAGDLLIYLDTRAGGADTTVDYNGTGVKSTFDSGKDFQPDFCIVVDDGANYIIKRWDGSTWSDTLTISYPAYVSLDSINTYEYAELQVPFSYIGSYDTTRVFRYLAVAQQESSNDPWNAFPALNGLTKGGKAPASYGHYYQVDNGLRSGLEPRGVSGILAVELTEFSALWQTGGVALAWRTGSETDTYQWLIDRSPHPDRDFTRIAEVPGLGNSPVGHAYQYTDNTALANSTYYYLLGDQDDQANVVWHGPVRVTTAGGVDARFALLPCRPNPANGPVTIRFSLPAAGRIELDIYDICGRRVRALGGNTLPSGQHGITWDGADDDGRAVATGVYFYRLTAGGQRITRKMTILR